MSKVSEYLKTLIEKQVNEKGIVVWYDSDGAYKDFIDKLSIDRTPVIRFEDSFFRLREQIESSLEFLDEQGQPRHDCGIPPRLIVYVPTDRSKTHYALVEAEAAGVVMEPGAKPLELNTRLRVIAEQVFKKIAPESADDIAREVDNGLLSLEDLDKLSKNVEGLKTGTVKLIFGTASAVEVTLAFAASEEHDSDIQTKHAMTELTGLFRTQLGIDLASGSKPAAARKKLWRILLAAEFLSSFPKEKRPDAFSSISIPEEPEKIARVKNICSNWRNRVDLRATYVQASQAVERELGLAKLDLPAEIINSSDTFSVLEKKLLILAEQFILDGKPTEALSLAEKRKQSFWSLQEPTFQLRWALVENSTRILLVGEAVKRSIKTVPKKPESMVSFYAEISEPWCFLDRYYRHLEMQYSSYDLELGREYDRLEEMIARVRQSYSTTVQECIETFTNALESADFLVKDCLSQENIYSRYVAPYLSEGPKLAYFLVDALRYEMGKELVEGLTDGFDVELLPCVAQLPTITSIGMAALMPNAEKGMELVESAGGKTAIKLGPATLKDRTSRVKYFEESVGKNVASFKLNELIKPSKKMLAKIQEADVILVTSQEIDRWAEEAEDEQEARIFMQEVLDKLRKAIHRLASLGVRQFVVTADHGHLFGETIEGGMKMDPPGGKTIELHRRLWVGKGGKAAEGFLRISASQIGLMGDLELAFPRSLACFKVKGGSTGYLHGGISLQEMVIPIITLKSKETKPISPETTLVTLAMEKPKITTRFFSITAKYKIEGLFGPEEIRVSVVARANRQDVGFAAMAAYGFEEGTKEIVLRKDKPNPITFMLKEVEEIRSVTIHVYDAISQIELARMEHIPVDITF